MNDMISTTAIAKIAHEANRAYCEELGDTSQTSWEDAPEWQKESAVNGVEYHLNNPGAQPSDSHNNWMAEKTAEGWIYGTVKDTVAKTHPCMVEYHELPFEQQLKDHLFSGIVNSLRLRELKGETV